MLSDRRYYMGKATTTLPPPRSPEERAANREAATRLALLFRQQQDARSRQVKRLVVMRLAPDVPGKPGICVGADLAFLARLYPEVEILCLGLEVEAVRPRWPRASLVRKADQLPPPHPGDRWVYYDPAALESKGGWRMARPTEVGGWPDHDQQEQ
jgi:hypothetical protein